jgi:small nuclear ribonucleoprotein (snRNP)-like protein
MEASMKAVLAAAVLCFSVLAGCADPLIIEDLRPRVQVKLNDGQVLVGRLATRTFTLMTGLGIVSFDTADAGELGPLEGTDLNQSKHLVRLWLRNGSEFIGGWQKPSVTVAVSIGGKEIPINVPIAKVSRLQFRGAQIWPDGPVFRIRTTSGDDFFVDVTRTRIGFENELGCFEPYLSEITHILPRDPAKTSWEIHLSQGMIFNGRIPQKILSLQLEMGPETISLPLVEIERMEYQVLARPAAFRPERARGLFYSNALQKAAKEHAAQSWK